MAKKSKSSNSTPKKSSFIANVSKSARSVVGDTAKDLMPNLSSAVKSNARFVKTTYAAVQDKFKETDLKENYLFKSGNNIIKNAASDIKTGNFNNKERQQKNSDDMFSKLLNFDFDSEGSLDDAFNLDGDIDSSGGDSSNPININEFNLSLDDETKTDLKTMANFSQANTKINNRGFAMMTTQLRAISTFQNQNTLKFYEMVEEKLNSLDNHLGISSAYYKDMVENSKSKGPGGADPRSLESAYGMKGFKIEEWVDIYKKNLEEMMSAGSMIGSMMIKPMITDFVNNPLGSLAKMGLKSLIPRGVKSSIGDLDKTLGMLPVMLQSKIPGMKEKGGLSAFFANILDLNKNRVKNKDNKFVKGPIAFDGITKRAITHVIPGYLKRILFALTGNERDNISYDMDKGKFVTDKDVKKNYRERISKSSREAIDDNIEILEKKYVKTLKEKKIVNSDEEASKYVDNLRSKMTNLGKSGKTLSSKLKLSDLSDDKASAEILKDIISNLDTKGRNQTNQAMAEAYMAYQQELRQASSEDLWHSVFDFGTISSKKKKNKEGFLDSLDDKYASLNKKKDEILKNKFSSKIKNKNIRKGFEWIFHTNNEGRNEAIENFAERAFYSKLKGVDIEDDGSLDPENIKKREKAAKKGKDSDPSTSILSELKKLSSFTMFDTLGLDPTSNTARRIFKTITNSSGNKNNNVDKLMARLMVNGKKGVAGLNSGLYQYSTLTREGLALKVKVVGGSIETTEGVSDSKNIEKNEKTKEKVKEKKRKKEEKKKEKQQRRENKKAQQQKEKEEDEQLLLTDGKNPEEVTALTVVENLEKSLTTDNKSAHQWQKTRNLLNEAFNDVTGEDLNKKNIFRMAKDFAKGKIEELPFGEHILKYGKTGLKAFGGSTLGKALFDRNNGAISKLLGGTGVLGGALLGKGAKLGKSLFGKGKGMLNTFTGKTGINLGMLGNEALGAISGAGTMAGNFMGNLGKVVNGTMTKKEGLGALWQGTKTATSSIKNKAFGGAKRLGKLFKRDKKSNGKSSNKRGLLTGSSNSKLLTSGNSDSSTALSPTVQVQLKPIEQAMTNMTTTIQNNVEILTTTVGDRLDDIADNMGEVIDVVEYTAVNTAGSSSENGGMLSNLLNNTSLGKKLKGSKLGGLLGKAKGALSGGSLLAKGAGLVGKTGGLLSKGAGLASGLLGGGLNIGAGLLSGGTALAAGLGTAATAAAPFLLPAAAIGAAGFGVKKFFDWRKKKKQEKELKKQQELEMKQYERQSLSAGDISEDVDVESDGSSEKKKSLARKLFDLTPLGLGVKGAKYLFGKREGTKKDANGKTILDANGNPMMEEKSSRVGGLFKTIFGKGAKYDQAVNESRNLSLANTNSNAIDIQSDVNPEQTDSNKPGVGKKLAKTAFLASPMGMYYSLVKQDQVNEAKLGENSDDPMTRVSAFLEPFGTFSKSSSFKNIFGSNGLFSSMFKGLKQAAGGSGGGGLSKFFKSFWDKTSGKSETVSSSGTGTGSSANQGSVTLDNSYATGILTNAGSIVNKSLKINSKVTADQLEAAFAGTNMAGLGETFIKAGEESGLDPLYLAAHAIHETGWGSSQIVKDKNNWYGIGAFDASPYASAYGYDGREAGIIEGAKWIAKNYANRTDGPIQDTLDKMLNSPDGWHNYATDPQWANKIANTMLSLTNKGGGQVYGGTVGVNGGTTSGTANLSGKAGQVVATAKAMIDAGYPYRLESGACDPSYGAFDCSGLMQYSYKKAGISIPRTTYDQVKTGTAVPISGTNGVGQAQPGDLLFCIPGSRGPEHVMMYAGNGMVHEAANTKTGLVTRPVANTSFASKPVAIRRILSSGMNQSDVASEYKVSNELVNSYRKYDNVPGVKAKRGKAIIDGGLRQSDSQGTSYSANNISFMDKERNDMMSKMIDKLDTISQNTGETNNILLKILDNLVTNITSNSNADIPLTLNNEMMSLYKGF